MTLMNTSIRLQVRTKMLKLCPLNRSHEMEQFENLLIRQTQKWRRYHSNYDVPKLTDLKKKLIRRNKDLSDKYFKLNWILLNYRNTYECDYVAVNGFYYFEFNIMAKVYRERWHSAVISRGSLSFSNPLRASNKDLIYGKVKASKCVQICNAIIIFFKQFELFKSLK